MAGAQRETAEQVHPEVQDGSGSHQGISVNYKTI